MDKLYRVTIEFDTVIRGQSIEEVERIAEDIIRDSDDPADNVSACEIRSIDALPNGWDRDCRPWGSNPDHMTIAEILEVANVPDEVTE
jgi:hypothetical protein